MALVEDRLPRTLELTSDLFRRAAAGEAIAAFELGQAAWLGGQVALRQGRVQDAGTLAETALHYAMEAKDSLLMHDAHNLRTQVQARLAEGA